MKKLISLGLTIFTSFQMIAQELPRNEEGKIVFEEVVEVEGAKKDQLYRQARAWFNETYMNDDQDEDVIYLSDSYLGEIAANPYMWMEVDAVGKSLAAGAVLYEVLVSIKDGKYKVKFYNFSHEAQRSRLGSGGVLENEEPECGMLNMQSAYWEQIKEDTAREIEKLKESLKVAMAKAPEMGNDDW